MNVVGISSHFRGERMTRNQKLGVAIVGVIVAIGLFRPGQRSTSLPDTTTSGAVTAPIPYTVVEARPIPGGRQARVIVIDSAYRTDAALRQLGAELHRDHPRDFILVYTDSLSATRRDRGDTDRLPLAQQK
jgi:hypothetical protein